MKRLVKEKAASPSSPFIASHNCFSEIIFRLPGLFAVVLVSLVTLLVHFAKAADPSIPELRGRVVAAGIPGATAVSAVGLFHEGGPVYDKPTFRAFPEP